MKYRIDYEASYGNMYNNQCRSIEADSEDKAIEILREMEYPYTIRVKNVSISRVPSLYIRERGGVVYVH